jgi:6-pyruvoyltetrahydropterin/6-carboxytetrahydropterin synthase
VVDFGTLQPLKDWLERWFDHTCLINADDPERQLFQQLQERGILDLRVLPNVSMEGSARFVWAYADALVRGATGGRAWCYSVEARENDKNAAIWEVARDGSRPAPHWTEPSPQG